MQNRHNGLEIRSKIWLETDGEPVFGRGRRFLLEAIDAHGSINRAAAEVGLSYRKAWGHITAMEQRLGIKLVERQAGGRNGGGTSLTDEARQFLKKFEELEAGLREEMDERFRRLFAGAAKEAGRVRRAS
jgi:molybdate transport system regulatory protein